MGFYSWLTQDTGRSISNKHSNRKTFPVFMLDDKGNVYTETEYDGYGKFGGKDYYELFAEMNNLKTREQGITLENKEVVDIKYPNLVEYPEYWRWKNLKPQNCPEQGYFYKDVETGTKNAIIEKADIINYHGMMFFNLEFRTENFNQGFVSKTHTLENTIKSIFEVVGVDGLRDLINKPVRLKHGQDEKIYAIGHFMKERWFFVD